MADETTTTEQTETKPAPKRRSPRKTTKPEIPAHLAAVQQALDEAGEHTTTDDYAFRRPAHERRAGAWGKEYRKTGTLDSLLLSLTFKALSASAADASKALRHLAAVALNEADKRDGGK